MNILVLLGDLNRHLGKFIPGNNEKTSYAGRLLIEFLEKGDYILLNATNKSKNGPFTRYEKNDPNNNNKKSALDLVIISKEIEQYVVELNIDKDLNWTPAQSHKGKLKHSDHYSLLVTFDIPMFNTKYKPTKKNVIWNTNKRDGWEKYKEITENNKELDRVTTIDSDDPEIVWNIIDKQMTKAKFASFGKVKIKSKGKVDRELESLQNKKNQLDKNKADKEKDKEMEKIDKEMANVISEMQSKQFEREITKLEDIRKEKGKAAAVFRLKEKILGKKKTGQEPIVMKDPVTGKELTKP